MGHVLRSDFVGLRITSDRKQRVLRVGAGNVVLGEIVACSHTHTHTHCEGEGTVGLNHSERRSLLS